jgi:hypothetical protein
MSDSGFLLPWTFGLIFALGGFVGTFWGDSAEKEYEARMKSGIAWFLMPGRLAKREGWVRHQKFIVSSGVIFALIGFVSSVRNYFKLW